MRLAAASAATLEILPSVSPDNIPPATPFANPHCCERSGRITGLLRPIVRVVVLSLAAWLAQSSAGIAQSSGALVSVWLTTPDELELLAPQSPITFEPDAGQFATTIDVNPQTTFQEMDGFGASWTDSSAWLVSAKLSASERNELMSRLFDPVAGIGLSYLRQPMGATDFSLSNYTYDDMPAGQTDFSLAHFSIAHDAAYIIPLITQAMRINPALRVIATPWSAPAWMKSSGSLFGGSLNADAATMNTYANYFVKIHPAVHSCGRADSPDHTTERAAQHVGNVSNHVHGRDSASDIHRGLFGASPRASRPLHANRHLRSELGQHVLFGERVGQRGRAVSIGIGLALLCGLTGRDDQRPYAVSRPGHLLHGVQCR